MVTDSQTILALIGSAIGLCGFALYYRSIIIGDTKPHFFTWFVYMLIDAIVFFAQLAGGGGPGAWVTLVGAGANLGVVLLAFKYGGGKIAKIDWVIFLSALVAIAAWKMTSSPLAAVIIATIANTLGLGPTFRKAFVNPSQESVTVWGLDVVRFGLAIAALSTVSLTTALFPIGVMLANSSLVIMILWRRRLLKEMS